MSTDRRRKRKRRKVQRVVDELRKGMEENQGFVDTQNAIMWTVMTSQYAPGGNPVAPRVHLESVNSKPELVGRLRLGWDTTVSQPRFFGTIKSFNVVGKPRSKGGR